ncbi:hypothetical protein KSF78_0008488 [Schistosoma japonicum]|nr:hypothetical protein KSF78_0008488 [Schistosoma japonicum]
MLSSSSSLLYINVLLLALIHSSIQIDDAIANVSKEINELEVSIDESKQNLTSAHHQLAETKCVLHIQRNWEILMNMSTVINNFKPTSMR